MKLTRVLKKIGSLIAKSTLGILEIITGAFLILILFIILVSKINPPQVQEITIGKRQEIAENHYILGKNWLKKNEFGIWEMYIEGDPYERGLVYGELAKELIQNQETIFVDQINKFVPSQTWQQFLRLLIGFFNKDLPKNIPLENQQEIYGVSQAFSDNYNYIASKYSRILNYHAAHDIGHALNDYSMVGCTSFALNNEMSKDGKLLVGRNFDFYVGDKFAEEKIILFVNPSDGNSFASYSWAGFTGVVSGLNDKGLSVTINASKSDLPTSSKTPISILAREILQYAGTLEEAISIAKKRNTFVSESILVSSKKDGKAIIIEKSPNKMGVYETAADVLICSNHYQSDPFKKDKINTLNIAESDSKYRFNRVNELLNEKTQLTPMDVALILRDQKGEHGDTLGMGNPRAINQLIAHHSVVIQPEDLIIYISTHDFQLGEYIGYNLHDILDGKTTNSSSLLAPDPFVHSEAYRSFLNYKLVRNKITSYLKFDEPLQLTQREINEFIASNEELYITFELLGKYYLKKHYKSKAKYFIEKSLTKSLPSEIVRKELLELKKKCEK